MLIFYENFCKPGGLFDFCLLERPRLHWCVIRDTGQNHSLPYQFILICIMLGDWRVCVC